MLGPPYGLLQGSLGPSVKPPPREATTQLLRSHVATILGTTEFYIALMDHLDWSQAHCAWGVVEEWTTVSRMLALPYRNFTHPDYGTVMRLMLKPVVYSMSLV